MFNRYCVVCDKPMGNSENRECYKLREPEGCFLDVHVKCINEFNKNKEFYFIRNGCGNNFRDEEIMKGDLKCSRYQKCKECRVLQKGVKK